jgi:2-hydroxychromene-2-carboxylate isomerase
MHPRPRLEFWFDFSSNYCYPAIMRIEALAASQGVALQWRPFLLGPVFEALGWRGSPLFQHQAKGRYVWRDMERRCRGYGLPFTRPAVFPRRTLLPMRIATLGAQAPWIGDFCRGVMHMAFAEDRDTDSPAAMHALLLTLQLPAEALIEAALGEDNKVALRARTEEALARGVFGAPACFVGDELFWGDDRLDDALAWARHGDTDAASP